MLWNLVFHEVLLLPGSLADMKSGALSGLGWLFTYLFFAICVAKKEDSPGSRVPG